MAYTRNMRTRRPEVMLDNRRTRFLRRWRLVTAAWIALLFGLTVSPARAADPSEFFEKQIRPLLSSQCGTCHNGQAKMGGLDLTSAAGLSRGSANGPIVNPDHPEQGRLLTVIRYQGDIKMPPTAKLTSQQITAIEKWVEMGAPWPEAITEEAGPSSKHWAFQPLQDPVPPTIRSPEQARNAIDRFILAKLDEEGLPQAAPANKLTLLRRAKFDLLGLPPAPEEIDEFLADDSPDAFTRLIEWLLASPRYGERWGRHWLDVARYADSTGLDEDHKYPFAWRYRDYVIQAFQDDLPYDQFVREQVAGDLLPARDGSEVNTRGIVATGFLALGPKPIAQQDKVRVKYDVVDEQIDTLSKAFLGLSIACARCHDHKFDPISTKDYYSLASIFANTRNFEDISPLVSLMYFEPLVSRAEWRRYQDQQDRIKERETEADAIEEVALSRHVSKEFRAKLADYLLAARQVYLLGEDVEEVARSEGLKPKVLEKLADYLDPKKEFRPFLQEWHQAPEERLPAVAKKYQGQFQATGKEWDRRLLEWREEVSKARTAGEVPPEKPKFQPADDRFFSDLSFEKGAFVIPEDEREAYLNEHEKQSVDGLRKEVARLKESSAPEPPKANAVAEGPPVQQHVFVRGDHHNPGEAVVQRFPIALAGAGQQPITKGSGRRELADWLVEGCPQLTSRVMVNRVWHWHFGEGLVATPNNLGVTGEKPSHPELLDYLASRFIESGWSVRALHRLIMLSATYQMSSVAPETALENDPSNRLLSHFRRRRLAVEELRDSLLSVSGRLDLTIGGEIEPPKDTGTVKPDETQRRTIYLPVFRNKLFNVMNLFDFGDATTSTGKRNETNVAPQALYMMNSEFVRECSESLADRLLSKVAEENERIDRAFQSILSRPPSEAERESASAYLAQYPRKDRSAENAKRAAWASFSRALLASNEFHYVD